MNTLILIILLVVVVLGLFVGGMLFFRKHAARIEAAALDFKTHAEQASYSIKSDAMRVQAAATAAHAGMVKAVNDVKAAMKNQQ